MWAEGRSGYAGVRLGEKRMGLGLPGLRWLLWVSVVETRGPAWAEGSKTRSGQVFGWVKSGWEWAGPLCRASIVMAVGWAVDVFLSLHLPVVQLIVSLLSLK